MKKLGSLLFFTLLTLVCLWTFAFPANAATSGDYSYEVSDNTATIVYVDKSISGDITIPDTLDGYPVTVIGTSAFSNCRLSSVIIPDTVITIENSAFAYCESMTSVTIGNNVTTINTYAFRNCTALTSVTIPASVTQIEATAFNFCTNITTFLVDSNNQSYCNDDYGVVFSKSKDALLFAPGKISVSYTIPSGVSVIGDYAFNTCRELTDVIIPGSVTSIGAYAFTNTHKISSIAIPASVLSIADTAFTNCTGLTAFTVDPDNPNYSSDSCGVLFDKEKTYLINVPCHLTGAYTVPKTTTNIFRLAFASSRALTGVYAEAGSTAFCSTDNGILFTIDQTTLIIAPRNLSGAYSIPDSVKIIYTHAFAHCNNLTAITIPDSVKTIQSQAFVSCKALSSVFLGSGVQHIYNQAFDYCTGLKDVYYAGTEVQLEQVNISYSSCLNNATWHYEWKLSYPGEDMFTYTVENGEATITRGSEALSGNIAIPATLGGYPVTAIADFAFDYCESITSAIVPDSVRSIGWSTFANCYSLKTVTLSNDLTTIASGAFSGCESLTSVTIPAGVTSIGADAFYGCNALTGIWVAADNANYWSDEKGVLYNKAKTTLVQAHCNLADNYSIPETVTKIEVHAFYGCANLTSITLPHGVTTIGEGAFWDCQKLTSITIPVTVTEISDWAMCGTALTDVYYGGTEVQWKKVRIGELMNDPLLNAIIHYTEPTEVPGDVDGVEGISVDDAIYLLQSILMPDLFPVAQSVDFNGDGVVNVDDAIYLLQHVLMPDLFPLL